MLRGVLNKAVRLSHTSIFGHNLGLCKTKVGVRCASVASISLKHNISIGDEAQITKTFTDDDVKQFSILSGDTNPMHLNDDFSKEGRYGKKVVHGPLTLR